MVKTVADSAILDHTIANLLPVVTSLCTHINTSSLQQENHVPKYIIDKFVLNP